MSHFCNSLLSPFYHHVSAFADINVFVSEMTDSKSHLSSSIFQLLKTTSHDCLVHYISV